MIVYNMEKRINAMVKDHIHIDYMFRDFDNALFDLGLHVHKKQG